MFLGEYCNPKEKIDYYLKISKDTIKIDELGIRIILRQAQDVKLIMEAIMNKKFDLYLKDFSFQFGI